METKVKNRDWVKNAAIIFLSVLLVLTFFSNTIMNRSLPEVATAQVQSGNIVAKVRGTGTVTANGVNKVKAKEIRTIRSVMVKVGQEVNAGDVLFVLGEGDATELETARDTLRDLQYTYQKTAVSIPNFDYSSYQRSISTAQRKVDEAEKAASDAKLDYERALGSASMTSAEAKARISAAEKELKAAKDALTSAEKAFKSTQTKHDEADARIQNAILAIKAQIAKESTEEKDPDPVVTPTPAPTPTASPTPSDDTGNTTNGDDNGSDDSHTQNNTAEFGSDNGNSTQNGNDGQQTTGNNTSGETGGPPTGSDDLQNNQPDPDPNLNNSQDPPSQGSDPGTPDAPVVTENPEPETPPADDPIEGEGIAFIRPKHDSHATTLALESECPYTPRQQHGYVLLKTATEASDLLSEMETLIQKHVDDTGMPKSAELTQLENELRQAVIDHNNLVSSAEYIEAANTYNNAKDRYFRAIENYDKMLPADVLPYKQIYEAALEKVEEAKENLNFANESLYSAIESNNKTAAVSYIDLQQLAEKIRLQQEKIRSLAGDEENVITANVSGTIESIECTAGDTVLKDAVLCSIEVPDMGHTLSFSVTNDQARRLRIGDSATVSNYYWGNSVTATLTTIRTDPKNPQTNKLLTFDLVGDVTTGADMTISVGQKSASYDIIIPNSAIKSDSNGSFVLVVNAKSSPLGNRYSARRVSIEVLASDDNNSAVVADLNNGDYVITTSSAPLRSGDLVRMADNG